MGHEKDILALVHSETNKAAPYITNKLATIGDGTMMDGIRAVFQFATKTGVGQGKKAGLKQGIILGAGGALVIVAGVKTMRDFRTERINRISRLKEAEQRIKAVDAETKLAQDDEECLNCEDTTAHDLEETEI